MKKMIYVCSPCRPTAKDPAVRRVQKDKNINLAKNTGRKIAKAGAVPIIPHLYFTAFLDDETPEEREIGMELGLDMLAISDAVYVVTDDVISDGMMEEIELAAVLDIPVRMFDSKGVENKHIKELVGMLKAAHEAADEEDFDDESFDDEDIDDPEDPGDPCAGCSGCDGCSGHSETHADGVGELLDSVFGRILSFLESDKDYLTIRIEKPDKSEVE